MKILRSILFALFVLVGTTKAQTPHYDTTSIIITRAIEKQLFDLNSVPYMQPLVQTINAASNARFYDQAYVPKKVDKPYFRFSVNAMYGFVRDDQREYTPALPVEENPLSVILPKYVTLDLVHQKLIVTDTAGLAVAIVKRLFKRGLEDSSVTIPSKAATIFGSKQGVVTINTDGLVKILSTDPEFATYYALMDSTSKARIVSAIRGLPDALTLPPGQNMNSVFAAVPQLEIGSLFGTELLLRYIPPVKFDTSVGYFSFFGVALKHSLSQYWNDTSFNVAIQAGYQGTKLTNTVGVTQAELAATADFFDVNIHASKSFPGIVDVYTGFDYTSVHIRSSYSYVLPREVQFKLGMIGLDSTGTIITDPKQGYYADDVIQVSLNDFHDSSLKWTFGLRREFGPVALSVDYAVAKFNVFGAGLSFRF